VTVKLTRRIITICGNSRFFSIKWGTVSQYLLGKSCEQMQKHRALDDARLTGMIWIEMRVDMKDRNA